MATVSANERMMSLKEIEERICNWQKEVSDLQARVRGLISQNAKSKNLGWMAQIARDEEQCDVANVARSLLAEMEKMGDILESKQGVAFREYERNVILREQLRKRVDIADCIIEQLQRGMSAYEIENKLARTFGGEYKWRSMMGNCLLTDIHAFFRAPESIEARTKMLEVLKKIKTDIDPDPVEGEDKSRRIQNLQQMEDRIKKIQEELTLLPAYGREICVMMQSIKKAQAKVGNLFP